MRVPREALEAILGAFLLVQVASLYFYAWDHPELTAMQVLQAAGEWLVPLCWMP